MLTQQNVPREAARRNKKAKLAQEEMLDFIAKTID